MYNSKFQTVYGTRIYPIDYLLNEDLSEIDLEHLLSENKKCLTYSFIIGMFRHIENKKRNSDIVKQINEDKKWMTKYHWTQEQCAEYEEYLTQIIKKLYSYSYQKALSIAQWYISIYGLQVQGNTIDL